MGEPNRMQHHRMQRKPNRVIRNKICENTGNVYYSMAHHKGADPRWLSQARPPFTKTQVFLASTVRPQSSVEPNTPRDQPMARPGGWCRHTRDACARCRRTTSDDVEPALRPQDHSPVDTTGPAHRGGGFVVFHWSQGYLLKLGSLIRFFNARSPRSNVFQLRPHLFGRMRSWKEPYRCTQPLYLEFAIIGAI